MKTTKRCSCCKTEKPLIDFCSNRSRPDGLNCNCRVCAARYRKVWREEHGGRKKDDERQKEYVKTHKPSFMAKRTKADYHLRQTFGITLEDYDQMLDEQNGVCAICGKPETSTSRYGNVKRLSVDHDHKTGKIRSLLCDICNKNLGVYENGKEQFEDYLRSFK